MNNKYIVRQPIKDRDSNVIGYELLYYGENQAFGADSPSSSGETNVSTTSASNAPAFRNDFAAANAIYNFLTQNTDKALTGTLNFMTFTPTLLMKSAPRLFKKTELVIQIEDNVIIYPLAMNFVQKFAKEGYKIAVNEFRFAPRYLALMDKIHYIKLNFSTTSVTTLSNIIELAHSMDKKCIATNITNEELYNCAINLRADALEGTFVAEKLSSKAHTSGYLQSNFFRLIVAITQDEPDIDEIEQLVSQDASMVFGLLRMANSVYFSSKHRSTTIRQAIMTLGLGQLRQWIYFLSASNAENEIDPSSEEFLKLSFLRANFCSVLSDYTQKTLSISKGDAYLIGMFSTLGCLVDAPMEEILAEVPVADEVKDALLYQKGPAGKLYSLLLSYERADWDRITTLADELHIPTNLLTSLYFDSVDRANMIWARITAPAHLPDENV
ncbi:HDOD domain protein [Anaerotignum neopropionicum]|uniref:HDOD domain protein n=1 Tax=Anaerotignum neopropionicum TaxID=36847 RepID=A0A136WCB3_9FIRM|nr:HDOD domain-containing protein [Anaerotignum neopropionicum]KXL52144.1 HDOD domain protein [Anaerotignum neopropionicum]